MGIRYLDEPATVVTKATGRVRYLDEQPSKTISHDPTSLEPPKDQSLYDALYPRLTGIQQTGKGNAGVAGALDVASAVPRAAAAGAGTLAGILGSLLNTSKTTMKLTPQQQQELKTSGKTFVGKQDDFRPATEFKQSLAQTGDAGKKGLKGFEGLAELVARDPANIIPGGMIAKNVTKIPKVATWLKPIISGAVTGASTGTVHQLENTAKGEDFNTLMAGLEAALGGGLPGLASIAKGTGKKILSFNVGSKKKDIEKGFDVENLLKHNLDAFTLKGMNEKTSKTLEKLKTEMSKFEETNGNIPVNLVDALDNTFKNFAETASNKAKNIGDNTQIRNTLVSLAKELGFVTGKSGLKAKSSLIPVRVPLSTAQDIKRGAGKQGAWATIAGKKTADPKITAREKVYNSFYAELKKQINKSVKDSDPEKLKDLIALNKSFEEIIPIEQAILNKLGEPPKSGKLMEGLGVLGGIGAGVYTGGSSIPAILLGYGATKLAPAVSTSPITGRLLGGSWQKSIPQTGFPSRLAKTTAFNIDSPNNIYDMFMGNK